MEFQGDFCVSRSKAKREGLVNKNSSVVCITLYMVDRVDSRLSSTAIVILRSNQFCIYILYLFSYPKLLGRALVRGLYLSGGLLGWVAIVAQ